MSAAVPSIASALGQRPRGLSIRALLLGAHAFVWLLPLFVLSMLRVYDVYLLRQTEHQLIAESVMVGEVYREALLRVQGRATDQHRPPRQQAYSQRSSPTVEPDAFVPVEAQVDFAHPVLPSQNHQFPATSARDSTAQRAGKSIEPLLLRAQTFNLSAIRVLDEAGCVVATTRSEAGLCMSSLPEVHDALAGRYNAVLRERISDEPAPGIGDIRRRGKVRVFTALPVWSDGRVVGVVRASRTGLDALSSLWANRRGLVWAGLGALLLMVAVSFTFSAAIAGPLGRLTRAARAVAEGGSARILTVKGRVPREIGVLHQVLFQMASKLEARASYVQEFASQVSHELKTPITAIRGAAELLAQGLDDMPEADRQRFIGNIVEDAHRMERLVNRLLTLARLENEAPERAQLVQVVPRVQRLLQRHGARVELSLQDPPLEVGVDPEQLDSVLTNLVENALRHGLDRPVRVTLSRQQHRLRIDVHDQGAGVSEANRKRLFERFFTTERDHGGTGLGLAIVKAIAEARGGSVSAHFDAQGSTFSVVL